MVRLLSIACVIAGFAFLLAGVTGEVQAQKAQMVKGTIKDVQVDKDVLIINQKVKNEVVDRELSILSTTEFEVTKGGTTTKATGSAGLKLLEGSKGSMVNVKCDKDVNVLKVTVKIK